MMNLLSLCLVLSTLAAAAVWSPPTATNLEKNKQNEEVIVKEGARVVVVEYDQQQDQPHTTISISPPRKTQDESSMIETTKGKISSVISSVGKESDGDHGLHHGAGGVICDSLGKCKQTIEDTIGKVSEVAAAQKQRVHEAKEGFQHGVHGAKEYVGDKFGKSKDKVFEAAGDTKEKVADIAGNGKERVNEAKEGIEDAAHEAKEYAKDKLTRTEDKARESVDMGKKLGGDAAKNLSEPVEETTQKMVEKAKETKGKTKNYFLDGLRYLYPTAALKTLGSIVHLLGFSTAYGTCVWVTFVSSQVLTRSLPRQQFATVQSKIHPVYFKAMVYSIGFALLGQLLGQRKKLFSSMAEMLQVYNLMASMLMVLANAYYLEPLATKVMSQKLQIEKEEGRGRESLATESSQPSETERQEAADTPSQENLVEEELRARVAGLGERLKKLNSYSSLLNVLTLMNLTWHLVYLSQKLHQTC